MLQFYKLKQKLKLNLRQVNTHHHLHACLDTYETLSSYLQNYYLCYKAIQPSVSKLQCFLICLPTFLPTYKVSLIYLPLGCIGFRINPQSIFGIFTLPARLTSYPSTCLPTLFPNYRSTCVPTSSMCYLNKFLLTIY